MDDRARFNGIYREHAGAVATYVRRRADAEAVDDVVADVFVVAWRRLGDVPDDPLPWLLGVSRRILANRYRGDTRRSALEQRMMSAAVRVSSSAREAADPGARDVWEALGALAARDREVLLLVAWEGLAPAQAARVLGIRANTFAARLHRARRRFARALAAQSGEPAQGSGPARAEVL